MASAEGCSPSCNYFAIASKRVLLARLVIDAVGGGGGGGGVMAFEE